MIAEQLKRSVLQAAIQGKLTQQLPEDGDASDLLREIQKEKAQLTKEEKEKAFPEITEDEIPFEIPENWRWSRVGIVFTLQAGKFVASDSIRAEGKYPCYGGNGLRGYVDTFNRTGRFPIIGRQGALCGNINIAEGKFHATEHAVVVETYCNCNADWAAYFLRALDLNQYSTATAQPGLAVSKINQVPFPVPPFAEQKRIVEHIEKLLPEIEELKIDEAKLDVLQKAFPKKMKDSILQYAVEGKLTEQLPSDGDARNLLKEIQEKKACLFKERKISKEKTLPEITEDEIPFDVPENWRWVRLGSISYDHGQKRPNEDFTYIDISSINNEANTLGNLNNIIKPKDAPSRARKIVFKGDVIYATVRPYLHNICLIDREITPEPIVSTGFAVVCTPEPLLNSYLFYCFLSPMFDSYANDNDNSKGVAYPAINDDKFSKALIPLPPLEEQQRIVQRLEELLPEIDKLEMKA